MKEEKEISKADYPFRSLLSFKPLIEYFEKAKDSWGGPGQAYWEKLKTMLEKAPVFLRPIEELSLLSQHSELLRALISLVIPPASLDMEPVGIFIPFNLQPVYVSDSFRRLLMDDNGRMKGLSSVGEDNFLMGRVLRAYYLILDKYYGIRQKFEYPIIRIIQDPETGLETCLRIKPNLNFMEIRHRGKLKALTEEERARILENLADPEVLKEILPPEDFEIQGLAVFTVVDVTQSETLSALGKDLIDQESIFTENGFLRLQQRIRNLLRCKDLLVSLVAIHEDEVMLLNLGCELSCNSVFSSSRHMALSEFQGSLYEKAVKEDKVVRIRDLSLTPSPAIVEKELIRSGIRSLMIAPLTYEGKPIGTIDIASPNPDEFGPIDILLLSEIVPIFSLAVKKALDEIEHTVQGIIKEKCTAVHPAVEWRFRKAAFKHLERRRRGEDSEMEQIVFRDVYPLYGVSDIRGSTLARNRAVTEDLLEHLRLGLDVLEEALRAKPLAVLDEIRHRLLGESDRIKAAISPGDEVEIPRFLQTELESLFPSIKDFGSGLAKVIESYEAALDHRTHSVYRKRKEFEESISGLNKRISLYLDREEANLQALCPHYFEKHQTDGVDYTIYLGPGLSELDGFSRIYLENFRLWQMTTACGIALIAEEMKKKGNVPLDIAHLLLFSHSPTSIRFRFDEKRFDVDGAYDIRQEIIKSRLDKALVKGGAERLTQPGMLSVVFSQPQEGREAERHMDFLSARGFLKGKPESLALEDLPGVKGLMAIRVEIDLKSPSIAKRIDTI